MGIRAHPSLHGRSLISNRVSLLARHSSVSIGSFSAPALRDPLLRDNRSLQTSGSGKGGYEIEYYLGVSSKRMSLFEVIHN